MRKGFILKLIASIIMFTLVAILPVSAAEQPKQGKHNKSVLVKLKPEKQRSKTNGLLTKKFGKIKKLKENIYYLEEGQEKLDNIEDIKKNPDVDYVELDATVKKSGDIVPWNMQVIGVQNTQRLGYYGDNIKVAVLDTGIDLNNSTLNVAGGVSFVDGVTSYDDDNGHGTAMAGIIAGRSSDGSILGAAPNVSLYSVKVLDHDGVGRYSDVIAGIKWAVENHMDIICMSFGSNEYSVFLEEAVDEAYAANVLLVAAAGNEGRDEINYPARYENVMAVGAVDENKQVMDYSNTGEKLDIVAPGNNIFTTGVGGYPTYAKGTSAATAHVVGAAAAVKSARKDLTSWQLNDVLCKGASYLGEKRQYGYGLVNANDSLIYVNQYIENMNEYVPTIKEHIITDDSNTVTGTVYAAYILDGEEEITINTGQSATVQAYFHSAHTSIKITLYKSTNPSNILDTKIHTNTSGDGARLTYTSPVLSQAGTYYIRYHPEDLLTDEHDDIFTVNVVTPGSVDNYEPNNTTGQATLLNKKSNTIYATIHNGTDVDYFKIYAYKGETLDITLTELPASYTLSLTDPHGDGEIYQGSGTRDRKITWEVKYEGYHYIKVAGSTSAYSSSQYKLIVNVLADKDNYEEHSTQGYSVTNNDSSSSAYLFNINTTQIVNARISSSDDVDWYRFTAPKGPVTLTLENLPFDYDLYLYNNNGVQLMSSTKTGTNDELIEYYVTENYKDLYAKVIGYSGNFSTSKNYTLTIAFDIFEPSVSNVTKSSANIKWTTYFPGTTVVNYGTSSGSLIQGTSNSSLVTSHDITINALSSATRYYYKAKSALQYDYATVTSTTRSFITRDAYEPNDTYNTASNALAGLGVVEATIDSPDDQDWFVLSFGAGGRLIVDLTNIPSGCDYDLVFRMNGNTYVAASKSGNVDERFYVDLNPGTYYVGVVPYGSTYDGLNKYKLKFSFAEFAYIVDELHFGGEGTYTATGNYSKNFSDLKTASGIGEFAVNRTYNSKDNTAEYFGRGWMLDIAGKTGELERTFIYSDGHRETIIDPDYRMVKLPSGVMYIFKKESNGTFTAEDSRHSLVKNTDGTYTFTTKEQDVYIFNSNGYLISVKDRVGNTRTNTVDGTGKVTAFTDFTGRAYTVTYSGNLISKIRDNTDGREANYTYTGNYLTKVVDAAGKTTSYTYDTDGYLKDIRDGSNVLIEAVEYIAVTNEPKKVKKTTDALGNILNYTYDTTTKKTTVTDTQSRTIIQSYDDKKFITEDTDPLGRKTTIKYTTDTAGKNKYGEAEYVIDANGNKTTYERDSRGNVTKIINPDGSFKQFAYDDKNNVIWERDEVGHFTVYQYDAAMAKLLKKGKYLKALLTQPTQTVTLTDANAADFAVEAYSYYPDTQYALKGLVNTYTDPLSNITTYTYDAKGNLLTAKDPETGKLTTYENNASNLPNAEISPRGFRTEYTYDKDNRLVKTVNIADGGVTRILYDSEGRKIREISPNQYNAAADTAGGYTENGTGTQYEYYANGLLKKVTNAENEVTEYEYDKYGNVTKETRPKQYDENGVLRADAGIYLYDYDSGNRLLKKWFKEKESAAAVLLEEYTYTLQAEGSMFKPVITRKSYLNDTETATTVFTQDYAGRALKQQNPDNSNVTFTYLADGRLNSGIDGNNSTSFYKYDTFNAGTNTMAEETWTPVENGYAYVRVSYDKAGQKVKEEKGLTVVAQNSVPSTFFTTQYTYYKNGRLKSETDSEGRRTDYFYDDDGGISRTEKYTTASKIIVTQYQNDYAGNPLQEAITLDGETLYSDNRTSLTTAYTYDKNNNLKTVTTPDNKTTTYGYDKLNRQTSVTQTITGEGGTPVTSVVETQYNADGNVRYTKDANGNETKYGYNTRGLLEKVIDGGNGVTAYGYDRAGRKTVEVSPANYVTGAALTAMNRTEYAYDLMSRMKSKTEKYTNPVTGSPVTITAKTISSYDGNGNILKETDALGYETNYTYTKDNKVKTVLDPVGKDRGLQFTTKYTYDTLGRKETETNGKNITSKYYYDGAGNVKKVTVTLNGTETNLEENTYDFLNNKLTAKDGNGKTTTYEYNVLNKVKKTVAPGDAGIPANTVEYRYDVLGNLAWQKDTFGTEIISTYDERGNLLTRKEQKADGTSAITTSARYDKNGNKRFVTDGNGNLTEYTYNPLNKVSTSVMGGKATTYTYDKNSNLKTETDWRGNTASYDYDPLNRLVQKKDANDVVVEKLEYNANGAQIKSYDALNQLTQYEYDKNNRLTKTINPLNQSQSQTYDNAGNIDSKTDGNGKTTTFVFDDLNRLKEVRATVGGAVEKTGYTYDLNGNMLTQTDGKNQMVTMEYNAANKLSRRIDNGGLNDVAKQESYTYYPNGLMKTKTDRNDKTTTYTYDTHGRLLNQSVDGASVSFTYDNNGNQLTMVDSSGTTVRTYDAFNRVLTKVTPKVGNSTFVYDLTQGLEAGQWVETSTDPKGNTVKKVYDKTGRLSQVFDGGESTPTVYAYYSNGALQSVTYPNGAKEEYTYYASGSLNTLANKKPGGGVMDTYSYTYDANGNQLTKSENINGVSKGTTTYIYDEINRLKTVTEPSGKLTGYTYDKAGNRETQNVSQGGNSVVTTYQYNGQNRLTKTVTEQGDTTEINNYYYDPNGNLVSKARETLGIAGTAGHSLTEAGTGADSSVILYEYNPFNQLTRVNTGARILKYGYNGEGLRVSEEVYGQTTYYTYEYDKIALETDGSGTVKARNLYGTNLIKRKAGSSNLYYLYNGHGDVTALIDTDGTVIASYYYDAFGVPTEKTGNADNPFRYAGYEYDEETGLYYLKARFYDADIARFIQEDTYRGNPNDPLSLNLYTYVHNNPLIYTDPTGHESARVSEYNDVKTIKVGSTWIESRNGKVNVIQAAYAYAKEYGFSVEIKKGNVIVWKRNGQKFEYTAREHLLTNLQQQWGVLGTSKTPSTPKVTVTTIINNLGLGAKDTLKSNWEGLKSLTTAEGLNNLAIAVTPYSWGDAEMAKKKLQMYEAVGNNIEKGYNEFVNGDWNVKTYYISRVGSEVVLTIVGTKGTQYATKVVKLGKAEELAGLTGKLDEAIKGAAKTTVNADIRKFSEYIFKDGAAPGKDVVYKNMGYGINDSEALIKLYKEQAAAKYASGDYTLGKADSFGQRINIEIQLPGIGDAAGKISYIKSGWMIKPDGSLSLNTPFSGFTK